MPYQPWQSPYQPNSSYQPNYMTAGGTYQMMQQPVNGIIKVNGPQSAMQVQLPPNSTSQPMFDASFDGKNGTFYVVSTDGTGTKSIEVFDFTPHADQTVQVDGARFVSREEFDEFTAKVSAARCHCTRGLAIPSSGAASPSPTTLSRPSCARSAKSLLRHAGCGRSYPLQTGTWPMSWSSSEGLSPTTASSPPR